MKTAAVKLSDTEFDDLRRIIHTRSGVRFPNAERDALENRLSRRLEELELDDFGQYIQLLTMGPYQSEEFQEMFSRIANSETGFFRNRAQLDAFSETVLPRLLNDRAATKRLRIWSAACSTGEEPYTLAMLVHRTLGVRLGDWRVEILGTDLSEKALNTASDARYSSSALASVDPALAKRYFKEEDGTFTLDPMIRSMVSFEFHNLNDSLKARRHGSWDVIFCRNVMNFFDDDGKASCLRMLHDRLADDGTLFVGRDDTVGDTDAKFLPLNDSKAFAYSKG